MDVERYYGSGAGTGARERYKGCVPTAWNLTATPGEDVRVRVDYDAEGVVQNPTAVTPAYSGMDHAYVWEDVVIKLDDTALGSCVGFSFDAELGMKTDRRFLKGSASKGQPARNQQPTYTGMIDSELAADSAAAYAEFLSGAVSKIEFVATGRENICLLYTSPSPRDRQKSRMPSSA